MSKKASQIKIDTEVRSSIASDLGKLEASLKNLFGDSFDTSEIDSARAALRNYREEGKWGYEITNLCFPVEIKRHLRPITLKDTDCTLSISVKVKGSTVAWKEEKPDYFDDLNFNVLLFSKQNFKDSDESEEFEYKNQFHIDKVSKNDSPIEMHPLYHVHYNNESGVVESDEKRSLNSDSPRLAHHPVELILGTILVIANYNNSKYLELKEDGTWFNLSRKYMTKIVYPYYKKISDILEKGCEEESEYVPYLTI